jgi:hypothetical protein
VKGDSLTPPAPHSAAAPMVCVCVSRGPKTENSSTLRPQDGRSVPSGTLRTQPEGRWVNVRGSEQDERDDGGNEQRVVNSHQNAVKSGGERAASA